MTGLDQRDCNGREEEGGEEGERRGEMGEGQEGRDGGGRGRERSMIIQYVRAHTINSQQSPHELCVPQVSQIPQFNQTLTSRKDEVRIRVEGDLSDVAMVPSQHCRLLSSDQIPNFGSAVYNANNIPRK